jgi:hypothetical protein
MKTKLFPSLSLFVGLAVGLAINEFQLPAVAQGTAFTYQGRLNVGTNPATGLFDMRFHIYSAESGGTLVAGPITNAPTAVSNGLFIVGLDFGADVFTGSSNWLQIGVRTNGSTVAYASLSPRQQLTPTPYAIYAESANAAGLSGAIPPGDLSGVSGVGLTGVALLAGGNTFSGNQTIDGMLTVSDGGYSTTAPYTDVIIGPGGYDPGEEHSINFNDATAPIGSLIVGYNGTDGYFAIGNLYHDYYTTGTKALTVYGSGEVGISTTAGPQQYLSVHGGVNIDQANLNAGLINNGNTNSYGLTFGSSSGEGIASERVAGANQYGLDFYTSFNKRMSITQSGFVGIGRAGSLAGDDWLDVQAPVTNTWGGMYVATAGLGLPFYGYAMDGGIYAWTYLNGSSGGDNSWNVYDDGANMTLTPSGRLGVNTYTPSQALEVNGEFMMVDGLGGVKCYIGDDGSGNDVQIGSLTSGVTAVACYNAADNVYMHLYCSSITIKGGADLAEPFKITDGNDNVPQGAVVVIDEENPGHLKMSDQSYDTHVAGVVSGANGINPGIQMQQDGLLDGGKNVALTGRVYVQADTSNGAIKPGDLLTTSTTRGHAMKVTDHAKAAGAILGKAMTGLSVGQGMVLVLVTLQ